MVGAYDEDTAYVDVSLPTNCALRMFDHFDGHHSVLLPIEKIQKFTINILRAVKQVLSASSSTFVLYAMYSANPAFLLVLEAWL